MMLFIQTNHNTCVIAYIIRIQYDITCGSPVLGNRLCYRSATENADCGLTANKPTIYTWYASSRKQEISKTLSTTSIKSKRQHYSKRYGDAGWTRMTLLAFFIFFLFSITKTMTMMMSEITRTSTRPPKSRPTEEPASSSILSFSSSCFSGTGTTVTHITHISAHNISHLRIYSNSYLRT